MNDNRIRFAMAAFLAMALFGWLPSALRAQATPSQAAPSQEAPASPQPDARYKADVLVVVAHPDDETEIGSYLARLTLDEHKQVAVLYGTRGNSGGNAVGYEQAAALGAEREIEARKAVASLGITNVWFIGAPDTAGQNVLRSLETWRHGAALEEVVRIVRLTRPDVILTWLPDFVVGENHEDHQAAGVLATEAFDMAGDPTKFPEQVAFPRDHTSVGNLTEGLRPWQPKKIYYFSDASNQDFLAGKGPEYASTDVSPSRHVPYYRLEAVETSFHLTQGFPGQLGKQAIQSGDFKLFMRPVRLALGKSLVGGTVTGDVFQGITSAPVPYTPVKGYRPQTRTGISFELGGPWAFYRKFWVAHDLEDLAQLIPVPEAGVYPGSELHVQLLIRNDSDQLQMVTLVSQLPSGWTEHGIFSYYPVRPHEAYPVNVTLKPPPGLEGKWQTVTWQASSQGAQAGAVTLRVNVTKAAMPE